MQVTHCMQSSLADTVRRLLGDPLLAQALHKVMGDWHVCFSQLTQHMIVNSAKLW